MTRAEHIAGLLEVMQNPAVQVGTLMTPAAPADVDNPSAVKVVTDSAGRALYFSRATIPYDRDGAGSKYFKHLGFYAYRKPALDRFVALPESSLERSERLEQLRFLENGIPIHVAETPYDTIGVDTEEDLRRVEEILNRQCRRERPRSCSSATDHVGAGVSPGPVERSSTRFLCKQIAELRSAGQPREAVPRGL